MVINIAIDKTFIIHNLVNKLFITTMSSTKKNIFVKGYSNKNNFMLIKSKKVRRNHCDHTHSHKK